MKTGDMVAWFTKNVLGVKKPCEPCKRRQQALNRAHDAAAEKLRGKGQRSPR